MSRCQTPPSSLALEDVNHCLKGVLLLLCPPDNSFCLEGGQTTVPITNCCCCFAVNTAHCRKGCPLDATQIPNEVGAPMTALAAFARQNSSSYIFLLRHHSYVTRLAVCKKFWACPFRQQLRRSKQHLQVGKSCHIR